MGEYTHASVYLAVHLANILWLPKSATKISIKKKVSIVTHFLFTGQHIGKAD